MKLTGKVKEAFEKWLIDSGHGVATLNLRASTYKIVEWFNHLPESMQWGIYQDFADSLGYELYISKESPLEYFWAVCDFIRSFNEGNCKTRQEARNASIEKLNELINEKEG